MKDAFKAVFWSFFGVRKRDEYEADAKRLVPVIKKIGRLDEK